MTLLHFAMHQALMQWWEQKEYEFKQWLENINGE